MSTVELLKREIKDFQDGTVQLASGFNFSQKETISRIYSYYYSKYLTGEYDSDGQKKYFYNIVRTPVLVLRKEIEFDTKDIKFVPVGDTDPRKVWLLEREFFAWVRRENFGTILNKLLDSVAIFGSGVLKVINGKPYNLDIRNLIIDQTAQTIRDANYIIEVHHYTPETFKKLSTLFNKASARAVLSKALEMDNPVILVYERYGRNEKGEFVRSYIADVKEKAVGTNTVFSYEIDSGILLREDRMSPDDIPYWDFHAERVEGRWLGYSPVEALFDPQTRVNEIVNRRVKASYFASTVLFQTQDMSIKRNNLTQLKNGEILKTIASLNRVNTQDIDFAPFFKEQELWQVNRDELTFSMGPVKGEPMPAATPLGSVQLILAQSSSYFSLIRENIALQLKNMLKYAVIPVVMREFNREHILTLSRDEASEVIDAYIENQARKRAIQYMLKHGRPITEQEYSAVKQAIASTLDERVIISIPENFYEDLDYEVNIVITGESEDIRVKAQNLNTILQAITSRPELITDPAYRKIFEKWLSAGGINPAEILPPRGQEPAPEVIARNVGGGVSRMPFPLTPAINTINRTI